MARRGLEHAQLGFHETGQVLLARAPADLGVTAERAHARTRGVHEDEREHAVGHDVVQLERIAGKGLGHHDAVLLGALLKQARLVGVVVDGDVLLDLRPVLAAGVGLQQDGLRGAAGADLEHAFGLLIGKHVGGHHLRSGVGDQDLALVELARKRGHQQGTAFGHAQAALHVHVAKRHRLHFLFRTLKGLEHVIVVHLAGVDGHIQRRLLVGCAHELDGGLRAHLLHEFLGHPRGERLGTGKRIQVGGRVAEREIDAQAHDLVQHGVGHARRGARAERLHHLHALVDGGMCLLAQEDELVG